MHMYDIQDQCLEFSHTPRYVDTTPLIRVGGRNFDLRAEINIRRAKRAWCGSTYRALP